MQGKVSYNRKMIRIAHNKELNIVATMMQSLYKEIQPDHYEADLNVYIDEVNAHMGRDTDTVYVDSDLRGFFIVRDETEVLAPTLHRYNGIRVYIQPEHRRSSLLAQFYKKLFTDYPDGEILGVTEIHSEHIAVLDKRHTLIAKVYRLNRR